MKKCVYDTGDYCAAKSSVGKLIACNPVGCGRRREDIDADPPLQKFDFPPKMEFADGVINVVGRITAQIVNKAEKAVTDAVIDYARNAGITELYLLDESFVRSALIHEAERLRELREECLRRISDMNSHEEEEE